LARLPKHYQIEATPFDPTTYEAIQLVPALKREYGENFHRDATPTSDQSNIDEAETARRARQLRLKIQGTLRWRRKRTSSGEVKVRKRNLDTDQLLYRWLFISILVTI
jgi:hypothetical protein